MGHPKSSNNGLISQKLLLKSEFINHLNGEERAERLFLAVPGGSLQFVIVVFPDYTHLLFFYYTLHGAMGVANSCLKYGVFIITWSAAIQVCKQHCESPRPRKFTF